MFQTTHGRPGFPNSNNYRKRILQSAAIRASVGVTGTGTRDRKGKPIFKTDVDFRCLRRIWATLFGIGRKTQRVPKPNSGTPTQPLPSSIIRNRFRPA
jgi:hypothetical protein